MGDKPVLGCTWPLAPTSADAILERWSWATCCCGARGGRIVPLVALPYCKSPVGPRGARLGLLRIATFWFAAGRKCDDGTTG